MHNLLDLRTSRWTLHILPPHHPRHLLVDAAAYAEHGPLTVLDCGRQYDASIVARAARGRAEIMDRITVQRAFICYEVVRLIQRTPEGRTPVLILDLLSTFYDENVRMAMRRFLLENTLLHLERLGRGAGLAVSASLPPDSPDPLALFGRLRSAAPQEIRHGTPVPAEAAHQPRLF